MLRTLSIPCLATLAVLLAACGSGTEADASATPTPTNGAYTAALAAVTVDDLGALVLQQRDYGLMALGMEISSNSGPMDNDRALDEYQTLEVTENELEQLGRIGGYSLVFENQTLEVGQIIQLETWIDLFEDSGNPPGMVELAIDDMRASDGVGGFELLEVTEVAIPSVPNASGWELIVEAPGFDHPLTWTFGTAQRGRLLAGTSVFEIAEGGRTAEMIGLLEQLDKRLQGAFDGTLEVSVEHVLPASAEDREVPPPLGGPDLAAMALNADDLGAGWRLDDDGYYADPDRLALFSRTFKYTERGAALLGGSEVSSVETELQLWLSVDDATWFIDSRRSLFEGAEGAAYFEAISSQEGGPAVTNATTEIVDLALGDQAIALTISADWESLGSRTLVFVAIRQADVVSWTTIESGDVVEGSDISVIADAAAARLAIEAS